MNQLPSFIETQDFASAYAIGEFILNSVAADTPIQRTDLEAYIRQHFAADGRYRFSCDQDCLAIGRAAR